MSKPYRDPKIAISKVYTKTGDQGKTALVGGDRVTKNHPRIEVYGTIDELNSFVGLAKVEVTAAGLPSASGQWLETVLTRVQHELFNLGSVMATPRDQLHPRQPQIKAAEIQALEADIDRCNEGLPLLRSFVLPGGSRLNGLLHVCRTVCRRAERLLVAFAASEPGQEFAMIYLNRLSDAFFVLSRWVMLEAGQDEVLWEPNKAASSQLDAG